MTHAKLFTAAAGGLAAAAIAFMAGHSLANDDRTARDDRTEASVDAKPSKCVSTPLDQSVVIDRKTLLLTDYRGNAMLLHMAGDCMSIHEPIGIEFFGSGSICRPVDVTITGDITSGIPTRCIVSKVEPISKAEAESLKGRR